MTDQQYPITPPHDQVYWWWEEACKRPPSSFYEKLDYVAAKAAEWGWQERDASVPGELQQARDQEREACCEWFKVNGYKQRYNHYDLHAARRPKAKSLAEEALEALMQVDGADLPVPVLVLLCDEVAKIRRALERLQELEGQGDG